MEKVEIVWKTIKHNGAGHLSRALVPGGWLVKQDLDFSSTIVFVADPEHNWGKLEYSAKEVPNG